MPSGEVAPGWVLPTCGLGHHHVAASPLGGREAGRGGTDEGINFVADGRTVGQGTGASGYGEVNTSAAVGPSAVRVDHSPHRTMVDAISLA